ncbi:CAP domain-containing protein [Streptomyces termitum]|uniref:CAP domain-containing protein n=1 Tax=Streptomyces termitum TaxID=67368 RepID=UPI0037A15C85
MGRHRRSGAAPAGADYATGTDPGPRAPRARRRGVRTGLIGASAAVAVGAVAVASGLLPGGEALTVGTAGSGRPTAEQAQRAPQLTTQGGATETPEDRTAGTAPAAPKTPAKPRQTPAPTGKTAAGKTPDGKTSAGKAAAPKSPAAASTRPARAETRTAPPAAPETPATADASPKPVPAEPTRTARTAVPQAPARSTADRAAAAEAEVVRLVNIERGRAGCSPVKTSDGLSKLAGAHSADMAARGFFGHTDPSGTTPWDRARAAGVTGLGAENIARGQVDAAAAMVSWMNGDQNRANIMNCSFTSLGVGVQFGDGGPWWTQDFGY